jgi:SAM-dependent methyltransferase
MVDYDALSEQYAEHRTHDEMVVDALRRGGGVAAGRCVLEVGCGTGNYLLALQALTGCAACGVDPSEEMLAVARRRSDAAEFTLAAAEAVPFADQRFDFVYSVDVIHHVADPAVVVAEAFRVLRSGGRLCIATDNEATIKGRLLARYFPETISVELARYPSGSNLHAAMAAAGFGEIREDVVASTYRVVDSRPYRHKAFSCLHLIPEDAFQAGLERLERELENGAIEAVARKVLVWGAKR